MIELKSSTAEGAEVEMIDLFALDGTTYRMPKRVGPNMGLKFLREARQVGPAIASAGLLEDIVGADAYEALMNFKGLRKSDLDAIQEVVTTAVLGAAEEEESGN